MPPRLLPALPGTLSSPGSDRQECPWMEKAGTASSPSQGHTNLQAGWHKYCMVNCCVSCLFVCVLRKIVLFSKSLLYLNLAFGPPSYSSSLPAFLALSSPSCLILPSPSSNHAFPHSLSSLSSPHVPLCKPLEGRRRREGGRNKKRGISGAVEALINIISLLTWWVQVCACVARVCVCMCVWLTNRQGWRAARTAYVVHLANNNNISLTVNNGPVRVDMSTR